MANALTSGYATSSTDTGHQGAANDGAWALGHAQKRVDFAYRAIHETAEQSKATIRAFYGTGPEHSYFNGCSNGGRQGLLEVQRYPGDYDGVIAGAPANTLSRLIAAFGWDLQALESDPASYISANKLPAGEKAAPPGCDTRTGSKDGGSGGWTSGSGGWGTGRRQEYGFATGFFRNFVFEDANWDYRAFSFDRDMKLVEERTAPLYDATNPDLGPFLRQRGKLIIYHG